MKSAEDRYCYLEPAFPAKAFLVILFLLEEGKLVSIFPTYKIYTSLDQASSSVKELVSVLEKEVPDIEIADISSLLPLTFDSKYPLKPEYWKNPSIEFTSVERSRQFLPLINNYNFYQILIAPGEHDEKNDTWDMNAILPIKNDTPDKVIEQFMLSSDAYVNHTAKNAALYVIDTPQKYNWKTGKVELKENNT